MAVQSYSFKVEHSREITEGLHRMLDLEFEAAQNLLDQRWSEEWIRLLGSSGGPAYKILGETTVQVVRNAQGLYLPSRFRRGVAEEVGRILRSQYPRLTCFEDVREVVLVIGLEGDLDALVRTVALSIQFTKNRFYKWKLIRQTLRMLRKWSFRYGMDLAMLVYTQLVTPQVQHATFSFSIDDGGEKGELFKYHRKHKQIHFEIKLPITSHPTKKSDWVWMQERLLISHKIRARINQSTKARPALPNTRLFTLKGGNTIPVLQFSWEFEGPILDIGYYQKDRVLAVDTGMVNLTTSVVCQAGLQIMPPQFEKPDPKQKSHMERLYELIEKLQRKLDSFPVNYRSQGRRRQEYNRLFARLARIVKDQLFLTSKHLLEWAQLYACATIVFEDLSSYEAPGGRHALSRKLNNWFRGALVATVRRKAFLVGIHIATVPPDWTSSYCPRCGRLGIKVVHPGSVVMNRYGRYFHCLNCTFTADRDYIGALNIYRVFLLPKHQRKHIAKAKPLVYQRRAGYLSVIGTCPLLDKELPIDHPIGI